MNAAPNAIATRVFSAQLRDREDAGYELLRVQIFAPEQALEPRDDGVDDAPSWRCSLRASGVIEANETVTGLDSFQALECALAVAVSWTIAASGRYVLRPMYAQAADLDRPPPEALTLMHGLISIGIDKLFRRRSA